MARPALITTCCSVTSSGALNAALKLLWSYVAPAHVTPESVRVGNMPVPSCLSRGVQRVWRTEYCPTMRAALGVTQRRFALGADFFIRCAKRSSSRTH